MSEPAASRRRRPWWAWPAMAAVLGVEVTAGVAAVGTFTLSTVPADRAATTGPYLVMVGCGVALLVVAALLWCGGLRLAAVLLGVAAVATTLGALAWFVSLPFALAAVVLSAVAAAARGQTLPRGA